MSNLYTAEFTDEAIEQLKALDTDNQDKILAAIKSFEILGIKYKNINKLDFDLFEIKPSGVRAYFKYYKNRIIIVGLIVLKKSQKAPKRFMLQASRNIENYIRSRNDD